MTQTIKPYANLKKEDLQGADLQGADLQGADLSEANLRGVGCCDCGDPRALTGHLECAYPGRASDPR